MRTRRLVASLVLVILGVAAAVAGLTVLDTRPMLGLDLQGGMSVVLTAEGEVAPESLSRTVDIIRDRVSQLGAPEADVSQSGDRNIIVQIPGIEEPERALRVIGRTAQLHFRPVLNVLSEQDAIEEGWSLTEADPPDREVIFRGAGAEQGRWFHLAPSEVRGDQVVDAYIETEDRGAGEWTVQLQLNPEGARRFEEVTAQLAPAEGAASGAALGIVLDRVVQSAPMVSGPITRGQAQISGTFSEREAADLALVLRTGALPIELEQSQVQRVSPILGQSALQAGLYAAMIGLALVALYMLAVYRLLGLITLIGLGVFAVIVLGVIGAMSTVTGFSLTLAGVAGIVVSFGIAADSYIVYFERIKDELKEGRTFRAAVGRAFPKAIRTSVAGNLIILSAALVLYAIAVGPVRGFALALGVAVVVDIVLMYLYAHPAVTLISRNRRLAGLRSARMRQASAREPGDERVAASR